MIKTVYVIIFLSVASALLYTRVSADVACTKAQVANCDFAKMVLTENMRTFEARLENCVATWNYLIKKNGRGKEFTGGEAAAMLRVASFAKYAGKKARGYKNVGDLVAAAAHIRTRND